MLTVTFAPTNDAQAGVLAEALCKYMALVAQQQAAATTEQPVAEEAVAAPKAEAAEKKPRAKKEVPAPTPAASEAAPVEAAPAEAAPASPSKAGPTLVDVRAKLAALSQEGKAEQVKALLKKYGAAKLTDVAEDQYALLLDDAEALQ